MSERSFVDSVMDSIMGSWPQAFIIRPADNYTLGIPDLLAWIPVQRPDPWSVAIEAKRLDPLMEDPFCKGRRTGLMLKHIFSGPQISMLRSLKRAGVTAFGLVQASATCAFIIEPEQLNPKTGNFTWEEMVEFRPLPRTREGWAFWSPSAP
jgi:hypothetical protein